jgi:hypothetical protein
MVTVCESVVKLLYIKLGVLIASKRFVQTNCFVYSNLYFFKISQKVHFVNAILESLISTLRDVVDTDTSKRR